MKLIGLEKVLNGLPAAVSKKQAEIRVKMQYTMTEAENTAKRSAPWTDRTGNARGSTYGVQFDEPDAIVGQLGIGVEYGKWLEVAHAGRFRIIRPTMDVAREKLKDRLRR